jgi:hypothetical protein
MAGSEGIDEGSSVEDVQEAFHRLGAELRLEQLDGRWRASVSAGSREETVLANEDSREAAARRAWKAFHDRQGGPGTS